MRSLFPFSLAARRPFVSASPLTFVCGRSVASYLPSRASRRRCQAHAWSLPTRAGIYIRISYALPFCPFGVYGALKPDHGTRPLFIFRGNLTISITFSNTPLCTLEQNTSRTNSNYRYYALFSRCLK